MKQYKYNKAFNAMRDNIEDTSYGILPAPRAGGYKYSL